jgi:uncharacterized protein (UPF0332 family)
MNPNIFQELERAGKIKKQKAGFVQIELLLKQAILDIEEAKKIVSIAERATYLLAYNAMLKAGRALILFNGYVPDDGGQHKTVVDMTSAILGHKYKDIVVRYDIMRRKRNEMTYEAGALLSKSESKKAFTNAIELINKILAEVKSKNPQLELEFY